MLPSGLDVLVGTSAKTFLAAEPKWQFNSLAISPGSEKLSDPT